MTIPYANALSSAADFALNSYISPRYARLDKNLQAPAQPAPAFFGIWTPIFAGRIAYGLLPREQRSTEADFWNHVVAATGFTYAYALVNKRFYSMEAAMLAMTFATYKYRDSLPEAKTRPAKAVSFAAEMGFGWLLAADTVISAKNKQRIAGREFTHGQQDIAGVAQAVVTAGGAIAANHINGWKGASVAAAWALAGVALSRESEKHVRAVAGVAAVGVLADLAWTTWSQAKASKQIESDTDAEIHGEFVQVDLYPVAPGVVVEEITTVRI